MSNKELIELFKETLTDKDKQFFTEPMNSRDDARFQSFKAGLKIGKSEGWSVYV